METETGVVVAEGGGAMAISVRGGALLPHAARKMKSERVTAVILALDTDLDGGIQQVAAGLAFEEIA
jgi:hypothetical protein